MSTFISDLRQHWEDRPFIWGDVEDVFKKVRMPACGRVLVLSPHPDDPESVSITSRLLKQSGCDIWYAIVSMSPSGVEDAYIQGNNLSDLIALQKKKSEIRRKEQTQSATMFELAPDRLTFLDIKEEKGLDSQKNLYRVRDHLESVAPDIVTLPIGKDSNQAHQWVYQVFRKCVKDLIFKFKKPLIALYSEDPKTIEIRKDLFVLFSEETANWKRGLLRIHDSQQQRNIHRRGMGFDERILRMNHLSWEQLVNNGAAASSSANYAEVFEIELFDEGESIASPRVLHHLPSNK